MCVCFVSSRSAKEEPAKRRASLWCGERDPPKFGANENKRRSPRKDRHTALPLSRERCRSRNRGITRALVERIAVIHGPSKIAFTTNRV